MNIDSRLESSSSFVTELKLSQVRLSHNACFPWLLLIPKHPNIVEIIDLSPQEQHQLMDEIALASHVMKQVFRPDKINVASLGNVVSQLHVHVIARYKSDQAWPNPVWNTVSELYETATQTQLIKDIKEAFLNNQ